MILLVEKIIYNVLFFFFRVTNRIKKDVLKSKLGLFEEGANLEQPQTITCPQKVFLHKRATILHGAKIIISPNEGGRLIFKENAGAAQGLTVITGNHQRPIGVFLKDVSANHQYDINKDVVVEDDVWLGANVTLLSGVIIGRGATVAAGSVCLNSVPPYAIVMGNPAKVIGFNFSPKEIIEHERLLYPEAERLSLDYLIKNYNKYFLNRITEIKQIVSR